MNRALQFFILIVFSCKLLSQELNIQVKENPPYYTNHEINFEISLLNNTDDSLTYFDSRGPSWDSFIEDWDMNANGRYVEILPLNGAFDHFFADTVFITLNPNEEKIIRTKTLKLIEAGDYSFTYTQEQAPSLVKKEFADSTVTDSIIQSMKAFKVSKNIKFEVFIDFDTIIHDTIKMPWDEWKDYRHVKVYSHQNHFDNLEAAYSYPQDVYALTLYCDTESEERIKKIGTLKNLRALTLRNYELDYYPQELVNLNLFELTIVPKKETTIDFKYGISKNNTLRELTGKFFGGMPDSVLNQQELMYLDISGSKIDSLQNLVSLQNLERLIADNNNLMNLQDIGLDTLPKLKELNLSGNRAINNIEPILACKSLEFLVINRTRIKTIPDEIENLKKLKQLSISNSLTHVSDSIGKLNDMRILSLGGNTKLTQLPPTIVNMKKLLQLNINRTAIEALPEGISDLPLEKLDMYNTKVKKNKDYWLLKARLKESFSE